MDKLSKEHETLMLTILKLKENAYGVAIRQKIEEITSRMVGYGTLYSALDQLVKKEYIVKITGEPTNKQGGRRKYFYQLTKIGVEALRQARKERDLLWHDVDEKLLDTIR